jgi:murein DD-endopeptidase MepM/ murein hydrolase activator NlpD
VKSSPIVLVVSLALAGAAEAPVLESAPEAIAQPPTAAPSPFIEERRQDVVLTRPAVIQDGMLFVAEFQVPPSCTNPAISWLDRQFRAVPVGERLQVLLPVPLGYVRKSESLSIRCGGVAARFSFPVVEGTYPESVLTVDPKFSQKPPARVRGEQAAIDAGFKKSSDARLWQEGFVRPTAGIETSPFGVRRTFNGKIDSRHRGYDFDGQEGDAVYAANDGVVVLAADDFYYTGNALFIDHGDQLFTMYFHLSRADVHAGDRVTRGQLLGAIGKTGRVTGPHLHFAVKLAGTYVNPLDLLRLQPGLLLAEAGPVTGR